MRDPWTTPAALPPKPDWHPDALCLEIGQTMFFADKGEKHLLQTAKKVCGMCTVRESCLEEALDQDERWGVFGGLGPRQRRKLAAERTSAARTPAHAARRRAVLMTDRDDAPAYPTGPGHRCSRGPVPEAYAELGALDRRCPTCGSPPNEWCVNKISGEASKVPCGKRNNPPSEAA